MEISVVRTCNITKIEVKVRAPTSNRIYKCLLQAISTIIEEPVEFILDWSVGSNVVEAVESTSCDARCDTRYTGDRIIETSEFFIYEPNCNYRVEWTSDSANITMRGELDEECIKELKEIKKTEEFLNMKTKLVHKNNELKYESLLQRVPYKELETAHHKSSSDELKPKLEIKSKFKPSTKTLPARFSSLMVRASIRNQSSTSSAYIRSSPEHTKKNEITRLGVERAEQKTTSLEASVYEADPSTIIRERIYWLIEEEIGSNNRFQFHFILNSNELHLKQSDSQSSRYHTPIPFSKMFAIITSDYNFIDNDIIEDDFNNRDFEKALSAPKSSQHQTSSKSMNFVIIINERTLAPTIHAKEEAIIQLERFLRSKLKEYEYW